MTSVYDQLNPTGPDTDYWLALAAREQPHALIDLGCGTGLLTVLLAGQVPSVEGVDPDAAALDVARGRDGHPGVRWVHGTAADLRHASADLVLMTGHVAQVFLTDEHWLGDLARVHRALRPGGVLAFDMRNPHARAWDRWTSAASTRPVSTPDGPAECWHETTDVTADGLVTFTTTTRYAGDRPDDVLVDTVRFRGEPDLRTQLTTSGFTVESVHGSWDAGPVTRDSLELLVTARRPR